MSLPSLRLKANADRRLRNGHLWVYSNEIDVAATPLNGFKAGDQAVLETAGGKPLGIVSATWALTRFTRATLDDAVRWIDLWGVGLLAGIAITLPFPTALVN